MTQFRGWNVSAALRCQVVHVLTALRFSWITAAVTVVPDRSHSPSSAELGAGPGATRTAQPVTGKRARASVVRP